MTLEEIIKQIEAEKFNNPNNVYNCAYDVGLDKAIEILRKQPVIKAKALRKKGTDEWYHFNIWNRIDKDTYETPEVWDNECSIETFNSTPDFPEDAELIDIEILIK